MQRLYCINNKPIPGTHSDPKALALIKEGQEYEGFIVGAKNPDGKVTKAWRIPSVYTGTNSYDMSRFIPLPDQDADEMADAEKEAIANLETVLV